jgi:hypothetical protein
MTPAHTLQEYDITLIGSDGRSYEARSCGRQREDDGMWEGWIEFESTDGKAAWRTTRETTQPNHADLVYWATGVSAVYLEGALARAMEPAPEIVVEAPAPPVFDGPAEPVTPVTVEASAMGDPGDPVLDPHFLYAAKGELMLRRQLGALAAWHLRTIARARCGVPASTADALDKPELIETIVGVVEAQAIAATTPAGAPASH